MLNRYMETLRGKQVTVLGIGVSNTPLIRLLAQAGAHVTARDKKTREQLGETAAMLEQLGVTLQLGEGYLEDIRADVVFKTPGMRPDLPQLEAAKAAGAAVTSEMEVFFEVCPCPIIAVTGSDGKTTTTTVIAEMLKAAGKKTWIGGNIGTPLLDKTGEMAETDVVVLELSSFQLMTMTRSPHVAVITNLAPNHLDLHRDMDEYVWAKCNIFRHQKPGDTLVLNLDNGITCGLQGQAVGSVRTFSRQTRPQDGVYLENGVIYDNGTPILPAADIRIPGVHNVENYMAAIAALRGIVPAEIMAQVAREFAGVEHRLELVRTLRGVRYYNDSIGTSPSRTMAGLGCFEQKVILIAGGYDKHIPFDTLGEMIPAKVKKLLLCGATADKIEAAVKAAADYRPGVPEIFRFETLDQVVTAAAEMAEEGDVVLLSPACASFDQFPSFAVRGRFFKEKVNELK